MRSFRHLSAFFAAFLVPVAAHAAGSTALPEPSGLTLLAIGVFGVALGRRLSSKRRQD